MLMVLKWYFIASLVSLLILGIIFYFDRKNAPEGFDKECSNVDDDLNNQGK